MSDQAIKPNFCQFYVTRHGQTKWNQQKIIQGHLDSPLTKLGQEQAQKRGQEFAQINFAAVFSSDLGRAKKTAQLLTLQHQINIKASQLLRERYLGKLQGASWLKMSQELKDLLTKVNQLSVEETQKITDPAYPEPLEKMASRLITFFRQTALAYPQKKVLVVTHGGCINRLLIKFKFTQAQFRDIHVDNLGYFVLETDGTDFFVKKLAGISLKENS